MLPNLIGCRHNILLTALFLVVIDLESEDERWTIMKVFVVVVLKKPTNK